MALVSFFGAAINAITSSDRLNFRIVGYSEIEFPGGASPRWAMLDMAGDGALGTAAAIKTAQIIPATRTFIILIGAELYRTSYYVRLSKCSLHSADNTHVAENSVEQFLDEQPGQVPVRGFLHRANNFLSDCLVLTHGAGGNCDTPLLVLLAESLCDRGVSVLRCDLPFRQLRPRGSPSPGSARRDQEGLLRAVTVLKRQMNGRIFLGGQSYGGRQASILAALEPSVTSGLLLLSYPLHPPGRSAQLRTAHFSALRTPALFVSGTRDAFGSIEELEGTISLIPAPTKLVRVAGAGHSLLTKRNREELSAIVVGAFTSFFQVSR